MNDRVIYSRSIVAWSSHQARSAVHEESRQNREDIVGINNGLVSGRTSRGSCSRVADYRGINEWDSRGGASARAPCGFYGRTERPPRDLIAIGEFWMAIEIESGVDKIRASRVECPWQDFLESDRAQSSTVCWIPRGIVLHKRWLKSFPLSRAVLLVTSSLAWRARHVQAALWINCLRKRLLARSFAEIKSAGCKIHKRDGHSKERFIEAPVDGMIMY